MVVTVSRYTPTEQKMINVLSDGQWHTKSELVVCLWDELGAAKNLGKHLNSLRRKMRPLGQDLLARQLTKDAEVLYMHIYVVPASASPEEARIIVAETTNCLATEGDQKSAVPERPPADQLTLDDQLPRLQIPLPPRPIPDGPLGCAVWNTKPSRPTLPAESAEPPSTDATTT